jgi:Glycosyltransferase
METLNKTGISKTGKAKILQVCAIDLSVEVLLFPLIKASMQRGYIVQNACTDTGKFASLLAAGLHMIHVPIERKISLLSNLKSCILLYKLMKKEQYDIVHVHTPIAAAIARIAAKIAGVKHIVYTAHGFYFHEGMGKLAYLFYYNLEKYFARYFTDWLLLQSKEDYELCLAKKFKTPDKILHISNGVDIIYKFNPSLIDPGRKQRLKAELGLGLQDVVITFIGRFVREKGIFELLEAFHRLLSKFNHVKLLLIGDTLSSERDQEAYQQINKLTSNPSIVITGFRKDIPELLSISDIFVLPSYREGLPRSIIEAMAMGLPVIATNIRGCREEVIDGHNGFLVEKCNADQLYEKMHQLVQDQDLRMTMGKNGRRMVEREFNEDIVIEKQLALFDRLTGNEKNEESS